MGDFQIPEHMIIVRTGHWVLSHRVDTALPGYLILGARMQTNDLSSMHPDALAQVGTLLAKTQKALNAILTPEHLYIGRYGHTAGHALHFHIVPVCEWVKHRFLSDPRYRVLRDLAPPATRIESGDKTDGAELTLYVWREFCENAAPREIPGPSIHDVVCRVRGLMSMPDGAVRR